MGAALPDRWGAPSAERFDAILCRHVLIYLDPSLHGGIAQLFARSLVRGGLLVLGVAERLPPGDTDLEWVADGDVPAYSKGPSETGRFATRLGASVPPERPSNPSHAPRPSLPPSLPPARPGDPHESGMTVRETAGREDWVAEIVAVHRLLAASHADAIARYRAITEAHGSAAEPWYALGLALQRAGDHAGARDALRSAVFLEPRMWRAALALGMVYTQLGQVDAARRELQRTLDVLGATGVQVRHLAPSPDGELCRLTAAEGAAAARARLARLPKIAQS